MKCDCIKKSEEKLKEMGYHEAECKNISFFLGESITSYLMIPFAYRKEKKNGDYGQGEKTIDVKINYCPFCGIDLNKD